jgi:hypothetical protein
VNEYELEVTTKTTVRVEAINIDEAKAKVVDAYYHSPVVVTIDEQDVAYDFAIISIVEVN